MEKIGYILLTAFYLLTLYLTLQEIQNFYPEGILILLVYSGLFVLLIKVIKERLNNKEDDYYSKEIHK
jgi:hypothetical protein|tara:strand:- start:1286 stop:1489 length:204 start_codon:yes stop_codon:yes gene_type:complete